MEKLIIKFIYFLLKFVKSDIASIKLFKENCAKIADGEYHTVEIKISQHNRDDEQIIEFTAYINGKNHEHGATPEEALAKFNSPLYDKIKVTKVLD
jgi:hypothetical protein